MKKTVLFAILALSINAFAQSKRPTSKMQHGTLYSMENIQSRMENGGRNTSGIFSEKNLGQAIKHQIAKHLTPTQIYDSIYYWQWDTITNGWAINPYEKIINIVFDANNNLSSYIGQSWNGSVWENSYQYTFTYNANNYQTSYIGQTWDGSAWVNYFQSATTYDANNNLTSNLVQSWDSSAWMNSFQSTYAYDANNNQTNTLFQFWNSTAWVNSSQDNFTYDANNNQTSDLSQIWVGSAWMNSSLDNFTYDANNNQTSDVGQSWNGSAWVNSSQDIYTYDANNNQTSDVGQSWDGSAWVNSSQYIYAYDANNNLTSELYQSWNGSAWVNSSQTANTFNANNFKISDSYKYWNSNGTRVMSGDSTYYYFHTVNSGIYNLMNANISVYPNPGSGKFTIGSNSVISAIEIYNLPGERIYADFKFNKQTSNKIDISTYAKGIYFIKIYNGTKISTRKIVVK